MDVERELGQCSLDQPDGPAVTDDVWQSSPSDNPEDAGRLDYVARRELFDAYVRAGRLSELEIESIYLHREATTAWSHSADFPDKPWPDQRSDRVKLILNEIRANVRDLVSLTWAEVDQVNLKEWAESVAARSVIPEARSK
jgi:hypothetical protein